MNSLGLILIFSSHFVFFYSFLIWILLGSCQGKLLFLLKILLLTFF